MVEWGLAELARYRGGQVALRIMVVTVDRGDGMSWSAHAAHQAARAHEFPYPRRVVNGPPPPGRYTALEELGVRRRTIVRLAQRHRLTRAYRWLGPGPTLIVVAALLAIGVAVAAATALSKSVAATGAVADVLTDPVVFGAGVIGALALLLRPLLESRLTGRVDAMQRVFADVEAAEVSHRERFKDFVRAVTDEVGAACASSCVIVEDLRRADWLTQKVALAYLDGDGRPVQKEQLWIIFEHRDDPLVAAQLQRSGHALHERHGAVRARHYEQLLLDERERKRLLAKRGIQAGAGYPRPVKLIVSGDPEPRPRDRALLLEWRNGKGRGTREGFDAVDFLHLLAVTETASAGTWFEAETIRKTMASHTREGGRWDVQHAIVGRKLAARELTQILQQLDDDEQLKLVMARQPRGTYEISYAAARALMSMRSELDLADPALCHLYWALYWHDRKRHDPGAIWIHKLAHHVREAGLPHSFGLEDQLGDALVDASVHAARGYVKGIARAFSQSGDRQEASELPEILTVAIELAEIAVTDRPVKDLRSAAWDAYSLLGDETILSEVLKLEAVPEAPEQDLDPLHRLFVDTLAVDDARADALAVLPQLDRSAADFAAVRAAWLALALASAYEKAPQRALAALEDLEPRLLDMVHDAIARVDSGIRSRGAGVAVDAAIASLGCWCVGVAARAGRIDQRAALDVLDYVNLLAKQLPRSDRRAPRERSDDGDFVREGLEQELLVVAGAGAALLRADTLSDDDKASIDALMREAAGRGRRGTRQDLVEEIERRMGLTEFMWERLGFAQLRTFMSLRRAEFVVALGGEPHRNAYEVALDLLFRESELPGVTGLLARSIVAPAAGHDHHTAGDLCRGIELALKGGVSPELARELCVMALHATNVHQDVPREEVLKRLLEDADDGGEPLVDHWLRELEGYALANAVNSLGNAVHRESAEPFKEKAFAAMRRRLASVPESEACARRSLELFELDRRLAEHRDPAPSETRSYWRDVLDVDAHQTAWAVHLMLRHGQRDEETVRLAGEVLQLQATRAPNWNTFFMAKSLINALDWEALPGLVEPERESLLAAAISYVEAGHDAHGTHLSPAEYRSSLELLIKHHPEREVEYRQALEDFDHRYERETLKRLLVPARQRGHHFAVVWHYVTNLAGWGLKSHPETPTGAIVAMTKDARRDEVRRRLRNGWPEPFTDGPDGRAVSAEFLVAAHALLETPDLDIDGVDEARALMEDRARLMLDPLLDLAIELPNLPPGLQAVFRRHREALDLPIAAAA